MPANVFAIVSCQIAQILALESRLQRRRRDTRIGRPQPHPFSFAHVAPPGAFGQQRHRTMYMSHLMALVCAFRPSAA